MSRTYKDFLHKKRAFQASSFREKSIWISEIKNPCDTKYRKGFLFIQTIYCLKHSILDGGQGKNRS